MGPVRGRLIALLPLLPLPAQAEVCDKVRPGWTPVDGPVGALAEAGYVLASPVGLILLAFVALAMIWPRRRLAVLAALPLLVLAGLLFLARRADVAVHAMTEGCIGGIGPTVVLLILIAAAVLVRGFAARRRQP